MENWIRNYKYFYNIYQNMSINNYIIREIKQIAAIKYNFQIQGLIYLQQMDDDYFSGGPPQTITPGYQSNIPHNNVDDQFDFGDNQYQYETPVIHTHQSNYSRSNEPYVSYSSNNLDTHESQAIQKMRQEEQKVMQRLRQKSEQQFEKKRVRKEEGQKQLEQFMERKYQQTLSRKQENKQKQQRKIEQFAKLSQESGWKKVAVSVPLKQGQHKGQKQINRMREAIINKKQDQS